MSSDFFYETFVTKNFVPKPVFSYLLSNIEKETLKSLSFGIIFDEIKFEEIIFQQLSLFNSLEKFFAENEGIYFVRDSLRSPKDAYFQLNFNPDSLEEDLIFDKETTKKMICVLHVSSAKDVLKVLLSSGRFYEDLNEFLGNDQFSIHLLPLRKINYNSEVRTFVKKGKLFAVSQYFDWEYDLPISPTEFLSKICSFIQTLEINDEDLVIDLFLNDNLEIEIIEINPYFEETEACNFEWFALREIENNESVEFRFRQDGIKSIMSQ